MSNQKCSFPFFLAAKWIPPVVKIKSKWNKIVLMRMPGDMGLPRPDPECTESEDSEEFEVDLCFLPPNSFIVPPSSPLLNFVSGWGTNMTDTQLSSESMDVSLWILPSLLEESDPVSPFDNFLSLSEMKFKHLGTSLSNNRMGGESLKNGTSQVGSKGWD